MRENIEPLVPFTKERFDQIKTNAESKGLVVTTRWRKGLKHIKLNPIVIRES